MASGKVLREWTDPLGRKVVMHLHTWNGHILFHHPDMSLRLEEVGLSIQKPESIRKQGKDRLFYRKAPDKLGNEYIKVTTRFKTEKEMFVTTAHGLKMLDNKGELEWKSA